MSLQMVDIEVRMPAKPRTSSSFSQKKPMAEVSCFVEGGASREIVVPVRVAKLMSAESLNLPAEEEEAFNRIHALEARVCFTLLTEMLSRRDYASYELEQKLLAYGFRPQEVQTSLARAAELRFINDNRFASYFIEERKRRGWGRRKIELELKRRGIATEEIPGYPEDFFCEDEDLVRAQNLLAKRAVPENRPFEKLVRHLVSKGFSYAIAAEAAHSRLDSK